jgi:hypothetical protein
LAKKVYTPDIISTKTQIDQLKQQVEAADPKDKHRLQHQLKEFQILQLWQLSQLDRQGDEAE